MCEDDHTYINSIECVCGALGRVRLGRKIVRENMSCCDTSASIGDSKPRKE